MRQRDDGAGDRQAFVAAIAFDDEGAVDLEDVDGETLQVGERRITGAEVVDRNIDAHRLQFIEHCQRPLDVAHQHAFGDFQFEVFRRQAGFLQHRHDQCGEILFAEQAGRDVDGDAQFRIAGSAPGGGLVAGLAQHEPGDLADQAVFFGQRNEAHRRNAAELGAVPAHQGLEAERPAVGIDLGLVDDVQFVLLDRPAQGGIECQPVAGFDVERFGVELELALAQLLGVMHGRVRMTQQDFEVDAVVGKEADAEAAIDAHFLAFEHDRRTDGILDAVQDVQRVAQPTVVAEDEHEFVAAVAGDGVRIAQAGFQPAGDFDQQFVAGAMTEAVVDELEVVEIDESQRALGRPPLRQTQHLLQTVLQQVPVGQAGERIVRRLVFQLLAVIVLCRHVLDGAFVVQRLALRAVDDVGVFGNPDAAAVAPVHLGFEIGDAAVFAHQRLELFAPALGNVETDRNVGQPGDQCRRVFVAVEFGQRPVGGEVVAVDRGLEHADDRILEDAAITQFGVGQLTLAQHLFGDILDEAFEHTPPLLVEHQGTAFEHPLDFSMPMHDPVLHAVATAAGHCNGDRPPHLRPVFRMGNHFQ